MRAFLAAQPPPTLLADLANVQRDLKELLGQPHNRQTRCTWADPTSIHLTFRFFADLDPGLVEPLRNAIVGRLTNVSSVALPLARFGAYPRVQAPRVVWAGPPERWEESRDGRRLFEIQGAIEAACRALGIPAEDKPWRPHLTIVRIRDGEREAGRRLTASGLAEKPLDVGPMNVSDVILMKSELLPSGPRHTGLWTIPLT